MIYRASKSPTDELSLTNCAVVNDSDFQTDLQGKRHVEVNTGGEKRYVFTILSHPEMPPKQIGFSLPQRKWAVLSVNQGIDVTPYVPTDGICSILLEADFVQKKTITQEAYDADEMAREFIRQFCRYSSCLSVGQQLVFNFKDKRLLSLIVKDIKAADLNAILQGQEVKARKSRVGLLLKATVIQFERAENSSLNLVGKAKGKQVWQSIINPDLNSLMMRIGGLHTEFIEIFRRAFASRVFPSELVEQFGCKHVKGILLYGAPGTGKTLIAQQIGNMLIAREPKIVNGPEFLKKYVGKSEANIRRLFAEAEEDEKKYGPNSELHIIIFDEIDAICKSRGSVAGNTGVHDSVINQLLSKIDGVGQLNNILVIGITNRRDMIDEALLGPGRLEVQVEIGLLAEDGCFQILNIHSGQMKKLKMVSEEVDNRELASTTKNEVVADLEALEGFKVTQADFLHVIEIINRAKSSKLGHDIKTAFGNAQEVLSHYLTRGIINWGLPVAHILELGTLFSRQAQASDTSGLVSVLLEGPPNSGKTALAAQLAWNSGFPFVKVCSPEVMVGCTEILKCMIIRRVFQESYHFTHSCILLDNIEWLMDYCSIGPRYSRLTLQTLRSTLRKNPPAGKKLLILCTSSERQLLEDMGLLSAFTEILRVPNLSSPEHLVAVLEESDVFNKKEIQQIARQLQRKRIFIGIKNLLDLIDTLKKTDEKHRVIKFLTGLKEEGALDAETGVID